MGYEENEYWNNRLKTVGYLNNANGTQLSEVERAYLEPHLFKGAKVIDYGAGDGKLMPLYQKYDCNIVCFDIAEDWKTEFARRYQAIGYNFDYTYIVQKAYTDLEIDFLPDIVLCTGMLMHVRPQYIGWVLKELKRLAGIDNVYCVASQNKEDNSLPLAEHNFNHDFEKIFDENKIIPIEYIYKNKIAYFTL